MSLHLYAIANLCDSMPSRLNTMLFIAVAKQIDPTLSYSFAHIAVRCNAVAFLRHGLAKHYFASPRHAAAVRITASLRHRKSFQLIASPRHASAARLLALPCLCRSLPRLSLPHLCHAVSTSPCSAFAALFYAGPNLCHFFSTAPYLRGPVRLQAVPLLIGSSHCLCCSVRRRDAHCPAMALLLTSALCVSLCCLCRAKHHIPTHSRCLAMLC